jgi:hypothetical protein
LRKKLKNRFWSAARWRLLTTGLFRDQNERANESLIIGAFNHSKKEVMGLKKLDNFGILYTVFGE